MHTNTKILKGYAPPKNPGCDEVYNFIANLWILGNDGQDVMKRANIYQTALHYGFEEKVIYRYMLHPEFKALQRGSYDLKKIHSANDPKQPEISGPWKTKKVKTKTKTKAKGKVKAKAKTKSPKKFKVPKEKADRAGSRSELRAAMRETIRQQDISEEPEIAFLEETEDWSYSPEDAVVETVY